MFIYRENYTESDKRTKIIIHNTKHTKNTKMYFQNRKNTSEINIFFNKNWIQNDQRFMLIFEALFILYNFYTFFIFSYIWRPLSRRPTFIVSLSFSPVVNQDIRLRTGQDVSIYCYEECGARARLRAGLRQLVPSRSKT